MSGLAGIQVGDGADEFEDAVVSASGEVQLINGRAQQRLHVGGQRAELPRIARAHMRVVGDGRSGKATGLNLLSLDHALAYTGGGFPRRGEE